MHHTLFLFLNSFQTIEKADIDSISSGSSYSELKKLVLSRLCQDGNISTPVANWIVTNLQWNQETGKATWRFNFQPLVKALPDLLLVPNREIWKPYEGQTLFVGGELSEYIPRDGHDDIRKHFPKAEFKYVSKAGHWVHAENPNEFLQTIYPYLE